MKKPEHGGGKTVSDRLSSSAFRSHTPNTVVKSINVMMACSDCAQHTKHVHFLNLHLGKEFFIWILVFAASQPVQIQVSH